MDIKALARKALSTAKREGASQAEVFAVKSTIRAVYVDDSRIKISEEKADQGIAMRVLKGRKLAQASSACSAPEDAEACARSASRLADRSPQTRNYDRFPSPGKATVTVDNYDRKVVEADPADLAELMKTMVDSSVRSGAKVPKAMLRTAIVESTVVNSNDLEVDHLSTLVYTELNVMAEGPSPGEGISSYNSPWLGGFDPSAAGTEVAEQARAAREAKTLDGSLKVPVLIAPGELERLLAYSAIYAVSAESVNKNRSAWGRMLGKEVGSKALTIVDDPSDRTGVLSAPYDDEGVPTSVKPVIEDGVLKTFLYDSYNSAVAERPPSGNGVRRGTANAQYLFQSPLVCSPINLVVRPGNRSREEMIASLDEGVLVEKFAFPTVDMFSGAFALEARLAYVIRKGALAGTIKHALVVGNMYEGLKNISGIGSDSVNVGSVNLPTVGFNGFEVVGSK